MINVFSPLLDRVEQSPKSSNAVITGINKEHDRSCTGEGEEEEVVEEEVEEEEEASEEECQGLIKQLFVVVRELIQKCLAFIYNLNRYIIVKIQV